VPLCVVTRAERLPVVVVVSCSEALSALRVVNMHGAYTIPVPGHVAPVPSQKLRVFWVLTRHYCSSLQNDMATM
jgi:hypothetical protein